MTQSLIGQLLGNRYRITHHISEGGYGNVFKAEDAQLGNEVVAVKLLRAPLPDMDPNYYQQLQQRFMDEARVSALLGEHPNIVKVKSYGMHERQPYLVMEYLNAKPYVGTGLDVVLNREGSLEPARVVHLAQQVCTALHYAHRFHMELGKHSIKGVIHRDIKPGNIFILRDQERNEFIKLLDFGISKLIGEATRGLTQSGFFLGTMCYASPEQLRGEKLDARSDIYSLGVVLYELLTGCLPFNPDQDTLPGWYHVHNFVPPRPFRELPLINPIPEGLQSVVLWCLEKEPAKRPEDMEVLSQELETGMYSSGSRLSRIWTYGSLRRLTNPRKTPVPNDPPPSRPSRGQQGGASAQPAASAKPAKPSGSDRTKKSRQKPKQSSINPAQMGLPHVLEMIDQGQYPKAVEILNQWIQSQPNEAHYYVYRGIAHQRQANWGMAQMDFQGALRLDPENFNAQVGLQEVLARKGAQPGAAQITDRSQMLTGGTTAPHTGMHWLWWIVWLISNWAGYGLGWVGMFLLVPLWQPEISGLVFAALMGTVLGIGVGIAQALILKNRFWPLFGEGGSLIGIQSWPQQGLWITLTALGYAISFVNWVGLQGQPYGPSLEMLIMPRSLVLGGILGVGLGLAQWLLLAFRQWRTAWWIVANGIDSLIAVGILLALTGSWADLSGPNWSWGISVLAFSRPLAGVILAWRRA